MGFTGDLSGLGQLAANLGRLAAVPAQAAKGAAGRVADLIEDEFDGEADAYGDAWSAHMPSTVQRWGEHPIHDLSGDERAGVDVRPMSGAGIAITMDTEYSGFHQAGTANMVARPVLPGGDFPPLWEEALQAASASAVNRTLGRR